MSITKTLLAGVAGTVLVGSGAMAAEPVKLSETQMDDVTAGVFAGLATFGDFAFDGGGFTAFRGGADLDLKEEVEIRRGSGPLFELKQTGTASAFARGGARGTGFAEQREAVTAPFAFLSTYVQLSNVPNGNGN